MQLRLCGRLGDDDPLPPCPPFVSVCTCASQPASPHHVDQCLLLSTMRKHHPSLHRCCTSLPILTTMVSSVPNYGDDKVCRNDERNGRKQERQSSCPAPPCPALAQPACDLTLLTHWTSAKTNPRLPVPLASRSSLCHAGFRLLRLLPFRLFRGARRRGQPQLEEKPQPERAELE